MTLVLPPQLETRLAEEARLKGLTPEASAEMLLRRIIPDVPDDSAADKPTPRKAGSARGQIVMRYDFDDPLEDSKEYMA